MNHSPSLPVLDFYTRAGCELCAETRLTLQHVLEQRVMRGDPIVRVREVDLADKPELEVRFGALLPVLALGNQELTLAMGNRTIERFLDGVLGRAA
jgi:hypothetical protein